MNWSKLSKQELAQYEHFLTVAGELSTDSLVSCLKDTEGSTGPDVALFRAACEERLLGRRVGRGTDAAKDG